MYLCALEAALKNHIPGPKSPHQTTKPHKTPQKFKPFEVLAKRKTTTKKNIFGATRPAPSLKQLTKTTLRTPQTPPPPRQKKHRRSKKMIFKKNNNPIYPNIFNIIYLKKKKSKTNTTATALAQATVPRKDSTWGVRSRDLDLEVLVGRLEAMGRKGRSGSVCWGV